MTGRRKVAIVGLGMIGGSLALALREAWGSQIELGGVDRENSVCKTALERRVLDFETASLEEAANWADVLFLCTPVLQIPALAAQLAPHLKAGAIVSDVGSTKQRIAEQVRQSLPETAEYVAGHPMAGRESSGFAAADGSLFRGKKYILLPEYTRSPQALAVIEELVRSLGAEIAYMDAPTHDRCAAVISHVPHVAAAALVHLLEDGADESRKLAGGGFKDTTRIASSNADMWADVCMTNGTAIAESLEELKKKLDDMIHAIKLQDRAKVHQFFHSAKEKRDRLVSASHATSSH